MLRNRNVRRGAAVGVVCAFSAQLSRHTAAWTLFAFTGGTISSAVLGRLLLEPEQGTQRLVELNVGEMFGGAAVASLLLTSSRERLPLKPIDFAVLIACAVAWLLPEPHAVYAGMTLSSIWLLCRHRANRQARDVAQVWLALSCCELWSKLAFKLVYGAVEPVEVAIMHVVGRLFFPSLQSGGLYLSARPDWSIVILEGCSSVHNLSLAALVWLCVLKIGGLRANLGASGALVASALLVVAINVGRILVMLPSAEAYHFWHDGQGSVAVALASVLASAAPIAAYVVRKT